jgi:predicted porin
VIFKLENGFTANTGKANQGGAIFGREAWVGFDGPLGKIQAGVTYTPLLTILGTYSLPANSDGLGWGHAINNFAGPATRASHSLRYNSPSLDGFIFRGEYAFPTAGENQPGDIGRTVSESVGYRNGAFSADVAYMDHVNQPHCSSELRDVRSLL